MYKFGDFNRLLFFEDFLRAGANGAVADLGGTPSGEAVIASGADAGSHTCAVVANEPSGVCRIASSGTNASVIALGMNTNLGFDTALEPVMQTRIRVNTTMVTTGQAMRIGFASAHAATADDVAQNAWIHCAASGAMLLESDDATTDSDDKATSVTLLPDIWYEFRIDASTVTDIKFYYRSASVAGAWTELTDSTTTFKMLATTAGIQPYIRIDDSGSAVLSVDVDYIAVWQSRE